MRPRTLVLLALAALALSRAPFFLHNPDWGLLNFEHCFVLSWPEIYANRQAVDPDPTQPFGIVDVPQFTGYHGGSAVVGHQVRWLATLLGTRTLLVHKVLGTLLTALFIGALAWALARLWPSPTDRLRVLFPLALVAFPPTFFLWATMTPKGHYLESHLIYGLFLPFYVAAARSALTWRWLLVAGLLGGAATAYCPSNGIFFGILLAAYLAFAELSWRGRLWRTAASCAAAAVALVLLFGNPLQVVDAFVAESLLESLLGAVLGSGAEGQVAAEPDEWSIRRDLLPNAMVITNDFFDVLPAGRQPWWSLLARLGGIAVALGAATLLLKESLGSFGESEEAAETQAPGRFMAINALLLVVASIGFLAFRHHLSSGLTTAAVDFLVPAYPPLFIGSGALLATMVRAPRRAVRRLGWAVTALAAVGLGAGWICEIGTNARPITRPEFGSCDSIQLTAYFYQLHSPPSRQPLRSPFRGPLDYRIEYDLGQRRCAASEPGDGDTCAFWRYAMESAEPDRAAGFCESRPLADQAVCARATGAQLYSADVCHDPTDTPGNICQQCTGGLHAECLSGAWQGVMVSQEPPCVCSLTDLCRTEQLDLVELSACLEQTAALLNGMPSLPLPSDPRACPDWPEGWRGLCERRDRLLELSPPRDAASCEAVYLDRYAHELPSHGRLAYDQCLVTSTETYPWCAIGIARLRGETDCAWAGFDESSGEQARFFWESLQHNAIVDDWPRKRKAVDLHTAAMGR